MALQDLVVKYLISVTINSNQTGFSCYKIETNPAEIRSHAKSRRTRRNVVYPSSRTWSIAAAHFSRKDDQLVKVKPLLNIVSDWRSILTLTDEEELGLLRSTNVAAVHLEKFRLSRAFRKSWSATSP